MGTMTDAEVVSSVPRPIEKTSAYAWVILAVLYIASVASALNQFKVPPVLPILIRAFDLSLSDAGMLNTIRNYSLSAASFTFSLCTIAAVFSQPLGGYLSDRLGMRRHIIIISSAVLSVICMFPFIATGWMIPVLTFSLGTIAGTIVPATFAAVPEIMVSRQFAGLGMAVLALGQNLGMFIGPILFGRLAESLGWTWAGYILVPVSAISVFVVYLAKFR